VTSFDTSVVRSHWPVSVEVEVRTRFDGRWSSGFEIVAVEQDQCLVRRRSDGVVLPTPFRIADIRRR